MLSIHDCDWGTNYRQEPLAPSLAEHGSFKRASPAASAFLLARSSVAASLNLEGVNPSQHQGGDLAGERTSGRKSLNSRQDHVSAGS
jgi:hypothetical protein